MSKNLSHFTLLHFLLKMSSLPAELVAKSNEDGALRRTLWDRLNLFPLNILQLYLQGTKVCTKSSDRILDYTCYRLQIYSRVVWYWGPVLETNNKISRFINNDIHLTSSCAGQGNSLLQCPTLLLLFDPHFCPHWVVLTVWNAVQF